MPRHSHGPLLTRASQLLGGEEQLRRFLKAEPRRFERWASGAEPLPWDDFLRIVDLLSDHYDEQIRRQYGDPDRRAAAKSRTAKPD